MALDEGDAGAELASTTQALLGGTDVESSCNFAETAALREPMIAGRTVARSAALAQCIESQMSARYQKCRTDPFADSSRSTQIAHVQSLVKSANPMSVWCFTQHGGRVGHTNWPEDMHDYDYSGTERIGLSRTLLATGTVSDIASTAWHEGMHVHDYAHYDDNPDLGLHVFNEGCPSGETAKANSVPYIVDDCMAKVIRATMSRCYKLRHCRAGYMPVVDTDPYSSADADCTCVRDALYVPNSNYPPQFSGAPRLGTNDQNDGFGNAMASGDFNGDGYADLAVGAPGDRLGEGRVYVYYGGKFGLHPEMTLPAQQTQLAGQKIGTSLAAADLDADGIAELFIGAPGASGGGAVYVYRGTRSGPSLYTILNAGFVGVTQAAGAGFGTSLAIGKLFDDRGYALAVGMPEAFVSGVKSGMVALFGFESGDNLLQAWGTIVKKAPRALEDQFGMSLAFGKLKSAVFPAVQISENLVIGAPGAGEVHVLDPRNFGSGSALHSAQPNYVIAPASTSTFPSRFGTSVLVSADLSDSSRNILVGAPFESDSAQSFRGAVYIFKDTRPSTSNYELVTKWSGSSAPGLFGASLAKLEGEVLVGAPGVEGGRVYRKDRVYEGGVNVTKHVKTYVQAGGDETGDDFGLSLAVGDFDNDGVGDFAGGAPGESPNNDPKSGGVYTYWNAFGDYVPMSTVTQAD